MPTWALYVYTFIFLNETLVSSFFVFPYSIQTKQLQATIIYIVSFFKASKHRMKEYFYYRIFYFDLFKIHFLNLKNLLNRPCKFSKFEIYYF